MTSLRWMALGVLNGLVGLTFLQSWSARIAFVIAVPVIFTPLYMWRAQRRSVNQK